MHDCFFLYLIFLLLSNLSTERPAWNSLRMGYQVSGRKVFNTIAIAMALPSENQIGQVFLNRNVMWRHCAHDVRRQTQGQSNLL